MEVIEGSTQELKIAGRSVGIGEAPNIEIGDFIATEYGGITAVGVVTEITHEPLGQRKPRAIISESVGEEEIKAMYPDLMKRYEVRATVKIIGYFREGKPHQKRLPTPPPIHNPVRMLSEDEIKLFHSLASENPKIDYAHFFTKSEIPALISIIDRLSSLGANRAELVSEAFEILRCFRTEDEASYFLELAGR